MRFRTIWSPWLRGYSLHERISRTREWLFWEVAGLLPPSLRYTTTLREIAKATTTSPNIPATPLSDILQNMETPKSFR